MAAVQWLTALFQLRIVPVDLLHVPERLAVSPSVYLRRDAFDARPLRFAELLSARGEACAKDGTLAGVVAAEHEAVPLVVGDALLPHGPQPAVVHDPGGDVELRVVDRPELGSLRGDRGEGRGHQLHDPARADPAPRVRVQLRLGHPLRLEEAPVEGGAEVALRVLPEDVVVARLVARGRS